MHLYLSSYQIGNCGEKLSKLAQGKTALVVSNALDFSTDFERRNKGIEREIHCLFELGIQANHLDLRDYFKSESALEILIQNAEMLWVGGGDILLFKILWS